MRLIILESMTLSHFRSFVDATTIEFPVGGLIYLTGINQLDPSLGSNGAGKSTIIDAIVWCLYGLSIRGERASDLTTWGTKERPFVSLQFNIDGETNIIARTGSPDTLVVNGTVVPQSAVDTLMGLSRLRFTNSVVFGQAAPLFMDLTVPARGELLAEMMDLEYWDHMSSFAGVRVKELTDAINVIKNLIAGDTGQLNALVKQLENLHADEVTWQATHDESVASAYEAMDAATIALTTAARAYQQLERQPLPDLNAIIAEHEQLTETLSNLKIDYTQASSDQQHAIARWSFLRDHKECPTCKQIISESFVRNQHRFFADEIARLTDLTNDVKASHDEYQIAVDASAELVRRASVECSNQKQKLYAANIKVEQAQQNLTRARADMEAACSTVNPFTHRIDAMLNETDAIQLRIDTNTQAELELQAELVKANFWKRAFPRVRLFLIRRILKVLEVETAGAASSLGVGDWHINFAAEAETKSGTTKHGVHVSAVNPRNQGQYKSYSFGETQRVKLAVSLGLASLLQSMSGVYHNVEFFDEPTAWLSQEGIDDLIGCLDARTESTGKTIWLIDHRSFTYPFSEVWCITKGAESTAVNRIQ